MDFKGFPRNNEGMCDNKTNGIHFLWQKILRIFNELYNGVKTLSKLQFWILIDFITDFFHC